MDWILIGIVVAALLARMIHTADDRTARHPIDDLRTPCASCHLDGMRFEYADADIPL